MCGAWYKLPVQFFGELDELVQNLGTIVIQFAIFAGPFLDVGRIASRCGQTLVKLWKLLVGRLNKTILIYEKVQSFCSNIIICSMFSHHTAVS